MKIKKISNELLWKEELKNSFVRWYDLANFLQLKHTSIFETNIIQNFPMIVTKSFAKRMTKQDINDPLLRQVIPTVLELKNNFNYKLDPLKELSFNTQEGLLHKYYNRVLIITSGKCVTNCRYCFRRNFDYKQQQQQSIKNLMKQLLEYIKNKPEIEEVILSGGDPLIHNNNTLSYIFKNIELIKSIQRIRIHTRVPIFLPSRITKNLMQIFSEIKIQKVVVIHANHPSEISEDVKTALQNIKKCNITLLNQSTLLKGINNNSYILKNLSDKLFDAGVLPYYLHLLDLVQGSEHFYVSDNNAIKIYNTLKNISSGFLVPKLSREIAHHKSKLWMN